jgi:hypothetical protein
MRHALPRVFLALLVLAAFSAVASADSYGVGVLSLDPSSSGTGDEFDIQNLTGSADLPPDFPVGTTLSFDTISLTLDFEDGTTETLTAADFTPDGFGGFDGNGSFDLTSDPITEAILTGTLSPTSVTLSDGTTETLAGTFSATLTDPSGGPLEEFDAVEIEATTGSGVTTTPEPSSGLFLVIGMAGLLGLVWRRKQSRTSINKAFIAA